MFDRKFKKSKMNPTEKQKPNLMITKSNFEEKSTPSKAVCQTKMLEKNDATKPGGNSKNKANQNLSLNSHHPNYPTSKGLTIKKTRVKNVNSAKKVKTKPISDYFEVKTSAARQT